MTTGPARAMVLAAGLGLRMRPITDRLPKPLVTVAGRTLLDRALDRLEAAGVERVVVNTHHLAAQIVAHLAARTRPRIVFSHEPALLETGGGVTKALPELLPGPFYVVNSDVLWLDGAEDTLHRLAAAWDDARMDALLLLQPVERVPGYDGPGDFERDAAGRLSRRAAGTVAPFLFAGVQLCAGRLFAGAAVERFSTNRLWDRAIARGRLFGLRHEGAFFHVGTPEDLARTEQALATHPEVPRGRER